MIEDRGEIFPSLEIDEGHAGVQLLANTLRNKLKEKASNQCVN